MKHLNTLIAVLMLLGSASAAQADLQDPPLDPQSIDEQIINLPWEYELKDYEFDRSRSTFTLSKGYALLRGESARRYDSLVQGTPEDPNTEALMVNHDSETQLIFNFYEDGYVSLDSWQDLDADVLLQEIAEATEQSNAGRSGGEVSYLKIGEWLQKPALNRENNSVSWVFEVMDGDEKYVNAITIKLGRKGYEKITWISSYDNYLQSTSEMELQVSHHEFDTGYRYADYSVGDKLAGLGIAGLVALTAGGNPQTKAGLTALLAGIVVGGKKLIIPILIALGALGAFFRKMFVGKNQPPSRPVESPRA